MTEITDAEIEAAALEAIAKAICCGGLPCGGCSPGQYARATKAAEIAWRAALTAAAAVRAPARRIDDVPTLTDRLRDNAISACVDAITAAMCVDAADYIDALEADLAAAAVRAPEPDSVPMPTTADQAALMCLLGERWLRGNAPERLRSPVDPVAWLYEIFDTREVTLTRMPKRISWTETPLYASPPPPSAPVGWRDIASAPKDGTPIDVWSGNERIADAYWHHKKGWVVDEYEMNWGWVERSIAFTHWMPLPASPPPPSPSPEQKP